MGFHSFRGQLARWILHAKPSEGQMRILEWGPGYSTQIMRDRCPDAEIWTYEHKLKWYRKWSDEFKDDTEIHIFHVPLEKGYTNAPCELGLKFHFIFIDGTRRVECMRTAYDLLEKGGIVMLHDSSRPRYNLGKTFYRLVLEQDDTAVMVRW